MKIKLPALKLTYSVAIALAAAATLALSTRAEAQNKPPQPVGGPVRFSTLKTAYDNGSPTNEQMLRGSWLRIAVATNKECAHVATDEQDKDGIKTQDKVSEGKFVFADTEYLEIDILKQAFAVTILNLGQKGNDQGPYFVDPIEPQFSTFAYTYSPKRGKYVPSKSYFAYRCRSIGGAPDRMICGATLNLESKATAVDRACLTSGLGMFLVYKKTP